MPKRIYNWTRYWYPRDSQVKFGKDGLLYKADSQFYMLHNLPNPDQFYEINSLFEIPCLILLGEPGMGKSYALREAYDQLLKEGADKYLFFNLADFESVDELKREVFQSNNFIEWQQSDFILHLFLDSLDEARIHLRTLTQKLTKAFQDNLDFLERLRVRITCRDQDWPSDFEDELCQLWGKENVSSYNLAPLQQKDIRQAAQQIEAVDNVDKFWAEVLNKEATPFAARPVTLEFLFDEYIATRQLPRTRKELYELGCKKLCKEINFSHGEKDKLEPEQRFVVAARVAAFAIFSGKSSIRLNLAQENSSNSLSLLDCAEGNENIKGFDFYVHESYVRETLDTALFRGGEVREWAHQTYSEFLAAWYVVRVLNLPQIKSLIFHPDGKLIPQLHETSAWIASFKQEVFEWILESDPEVLLRSDVATGDDKSREKLVVALLEWRNNNPHSDFAWEKITSLYCNNLSQILRAFILDKVNKPRARGLGIDIAIACRQSGLEDLMVEIALNNDEFSFVRQLSAQWIVEVGNSEAKQQLRPIAMLSLENRELGELKRYGILATWPNYLSAEELFSILEVPSGDLLSDPYIYQNWSSLIFPKLPVDKLPFALEWIQVQKFKYHSSRSFSQTFSELMDTILFLAWQNLEIPEITVAFCQTSIALWEGHDDVISHRGGDRKLTDNSNIITPELVLQDNNRRYLFLQSLIPIASKHTEIGHNLIYDIPYVTFNDAPWLVDYFLLCKAPEEKNLIGKLLRFTVRLFEPEQFEFIYNVGQKNPELWHELSYQLFIEFDSAEAQKEKSTYLIGLNRELKREERKQKPESPPLISSPAERVLAYINKFEEGNVDDWPNMSYWMMFNPNGMYLNIHLHEFDFDELPVWKELGEIQKQTIINSIPLFLKQSDPDIAMCNNSWWEKRDLRFWHIIAGCRAIFSLNLDQFDLLTDKDWKKWAPAFTYYVYDSLVYINEESKQKRKITFLKYFKAIAPEEVNETILWIAEGENKTEHFYIASRIDELLDKPLAELFLQSIEDEKFKLVNESPILRAICRVDFELAQPLLENWLEVSTPRSEKEIRRKILAGQLFLAFASDLGWELIWPEVQKDTEYGRKVIEGLSSPDRNLRIGLNNLNEKSLGELMIWLYQQYPEDDYYLENGFVTTEQEVARLRDLIPNLLVQRGTKESISQLTYAQNTLKRGMSYYLAQAQVNYLQNTWQPIEPNEFREFTQNNRSRWIQSGSQLIEAIIEILQQLDIELQGQSGATPSAIELWNEVNRRVDGKQKTFYTPKDENRLSDYLERYLKRSLEGYNVFISRENQVRRGSFTDIYVETKPLLSKDQFGQSITVVIEVKGCWNPDLKISMQEQLKDRYLQENGFRHGIYLIGRYMCNSWDKTKDNNRWSASAKYKDDELKEFVENQAKQLSTDDYDIRPFILNTKL